MSWVWLGGSTFRPASSSVLTASSTDLPATSGTVVVAGPVEMVTVTVDSFSTCLPAAGSLEIAVPPFGSSDAASVRWYRRSASVIACFA